MMVMVMLSWVSIDMLHVLRVLSIACVTIVLVSVSSAFRLGCDLLISVFVYWSGSLWGAHVGSLWGM